MGKALLSIPTVAKIEALYRPWPKYKVNASEEGQYVVHVNKWWKDDDMQSPRNLMHDDLSKTLFGNFGSSGTFLRSYGLLRTSASIWLEKGRYSVYRSSAGYIYEVPIWN